MVDLFPVTVTLPDGTAILEARLRILPDGRLYVWDAWSGQIRQRLTTLIVPGSDLPSGYQSQHVITDVATDVGVVQVRRSGGCGCSNPLKHADPLAGAHA